MTESRLSGFFKLPVNERIDALEAGGWLSTADADALRDGRQVVSIRSADKMIENVIGTFGMPLGIAPNFRVDGCDYVVPLVVEEPSIVAALSAAARLARRTGGFSTHCEESLLAGQVHLAGIDDIEAASRAVLEARSALLDEANAVHPRLTHRGGGARDIEVHVVATETHGDVLAVHVLVDTCDAMGANLVNTLCEALAPTLEAITGGAVALRILSNLVDRSLVTATARFPLRGLALGKHGAVEARDGIVLANAIARADPHRAATHNKGVMNGIDAVAVATGNDWRAIEAGAHAYAARDGRYRALTDWRVGDDGDLVGEICLPLKVGTVGGTLELNDAAAIGLRITAVESAVELARLMAAVGLAQNFSALRALATTGIQAGHMRLHARSIAAAVGTPDNHFGAVVDALIDSGEVKEWKAREILADVLEADAAATPAMSAAGKVILFGEHAAVYGKHALAVPVDEAMHARVERNAEPSITIPDWGVHKAVDLEAGADAGLDAAVALIRRELGLEHARFALAVRARVPRAMGLGSSASLAVAITRALAEAYDVELDDERTNAIAYECEKLAHGTPSGVDNTLATFGRPMLFRRGDGLETRELPLSAPLPIVIGCSKTRGLTLAQVEAVRSRREQNPLHYDAVFEQIEALTLAAVDAIDAGDHATLGRLMNLCHGLLNAIEVSTPELERMIGIARSAGALGAKLTGGGGGGSIVALAPGRTKEVETALRAAGFDTLSAAT